MYFLYTAEHVQDTVDFDDELSSGNMLLVYIYMYINIIRSL